LRNTIKILVFCVLLGQASGSSGQNETYLLPFGNRAALNPSFAGLNNNYSYHTGNQYYFINSEQTYNLFYASWDAYSDKLKGGVALSFSQGLISQRNISTSQFGASYSGFPIATKNGEILLSAGTNLGVGTKQWSVAFLDEVLTDKDDASSLPGKAFLRYALIKPQVGFLWMSEQFQLGLTAAVPYRFDIATDAIEPLEESTPLSLTLYLAKKMNKKIRDLYSRPFLLSPELIVFYHEEFIFSRLRMVSEHTNKTWGFFIQNDFTNQIHTFGGTLGYRNNYVRLNINTGLGIPGLSDSNAFLCELSLHIIVPPFNYSKNYPWSPDKN